MSEALPKGTLPVRASALPTVTAPPSPPEWRAMREQAEVIVRSGMAPRGVNTPEKVLAIALKGRELSIPPMQALSHIHIVEGKPTLSAELMMALVQRAGHKIRVIETDSEKCVLEGIRADDPEYPQHFSFTVEEAKQAGLLGKNVWKSYRPAMLRSRPISALCRVVFADVLMGASYTPEELGAEVDAEGKVVQLRPDGENESVEVEVMDEGQRKPESQGETPKLRKTEQELLRTLIEETGHSVESFEEKIGRIDAIPREVGEKWIERLNREVEESDDDEESAGDDNDAEADEDFGGSLSGEEVREIEDSVDESEDSENPESEFDKGRLPATRKQLNYLESLVADVEDGVAKFEERIGKRIAELTREEASEWIGKLSGKAT